MPTVAGRCRRGGSDGGTGGPSSHGVRYQSSQGQEGHHPPCLPGCSTHPAHSAATPIIPGRQGPPSASTLGPNSASARREPACLGLCQRDCSALLTTCTHPTLIQFTAFARVCCHQCQRRTGAARHLPDQRDSPTRRAPGGGPSPLTHHSSWGLLHCFAGRFPEARLECKLPNRSVYLEGQNTLFKNKNYLPRNRFHVLNGSLVLGTQRGLCSFKNGASRSAPGVGISLLDGKTQQ